MITLSKRDTYYIIYLKRKRKALHKKYSFSTKLETKCLNCFDKIYISFKEFNNSSVFCINCKHKYDPKSIIQLQYMRVLKQKQIELIENVYNESKYK